MWQLSPSLFGCTVPGQTSQACHQQPCSFRGDIIQLYHMALHLGVYLKPPLGPDLLRLHGLRSAGTFFETRYLMPRYLGIAGILTFERGVGVGVGWVGVEEWEGTRWGRKCTPKAWGFRVHRRGDWSAGEKVEVEGGFRTCKQFGGVGKRSL